MTKHEENAIGAAIAATARRTAAEIHVVVHPASGHYRDFSIMCGFVLGSFISLALWFNGTSSFPLLIGVQMGTALIVGLVPPIHRLCVRLVPQRIRHRHGAEAAHRAYLAIHAGTPADRPFVLLFISLAERYVHVVTNPVVHARIPSNWGEVTRQFINSIRVNGLAKTCVDAVDDIAGGLSSQFPAK